MGAVGATVGSAGGPTAAAWAQLGAGLTGTLVLPSDADYDVARQLCYAQYDSIYPQAIAYCATPADVSTCVRFATRNGIPARARSGGHSSAGYSTTTGLVIDLSRLNSVRIGTGSVTVGAGTQQVDAVAALAPSGLALPGGLAATVAMAGFVQGGGLGLLTRKYGMACDHVLGADVVLADGSSLHCSPTSQPDLFWALCGGGGGNFGIVTAFQLAPVAISGLVNFTLTWPWDVAAAVLTGWQEWLLASPRESGAELVISLPDAAPGNVPLVTVSGAWCGDPAGAAANVNALISAVGSSPTTNTSSQLSYQDSAMAWYGCSTRTVPQCHRVGYSSAGALPRGEFLVSRTRMFSDQVPGSGVSDILAAYDANRLPGHTRVFSTAGLGGAVNDVARTATAYVHRDTQFSFIAATTLPTGQPAQADRDAANAWATTVFDTMDPYSNGETYQNFMDPALVDWRRSYYAENYPRLVAVKQEYDPTRFFSFPQAVG